MPHNPRRPTVVQPSIALQITNDQIDAAIVRALELRRRTAVDPVSVQAYPLSARDAVEYTESARSRFPDRRGQRRGREDAWFWVGWISLEVGEWAYSESGWVTPYAATWQVWLHSSAMDESG